MLGLRTVAAAAICLLGLGQGSVATALGNGMGNHLGLSLFSEPGFTGNKCDIHSPCPKISPGTTWKQFPNLLNQRVFSNIADLEPYGFADIVRSVECPSNDVCLGLQNDKDKLENSNDQKELMAYWTDVRFLPAGTVVVS
ncbi:hypothetical protein B0H63DRAFT_455600 [Podospora didyma]|uniref:Ecp2 effector protein domain-containing protein n=1 Tax=Podospora didyma TaxID=330526 RepID=A0AAE0K008_9PEZI|nr:hypothetical protein B0H63DRAFT_455600 [Podospora didyma]